MADIQYLSYGNQQVEKQALLNQMADSVTTYVNKQPWSRKRKEKFISAYSDMLSHGILGASSDSGQWVVNVDGEIDLNSKSKKDKQMYQEAAWFIRHQMQSLAQDKDKQEENEIVKTPFDFNKDFINYVSNQKFGSNDFKTSQWNEFDERNKYGIRGTENRMRILSELLKSYSDNFDESKFDFKDSPYRNSVDLKNRIGEAITALGTPDKRDDLEKLYAIGLNPADWFNNGSGDPSGYEIDGKELTNGEYYDAIQKAEREKYEEYVKKSKQYIENLKKQEGTISSSQITNQQSPGSKTFGQRGFTTAEQIELGSIIGDIASIVYPGAIGGAVLGGGSAVARTVASAMRGDLNLWDRLLDFGTGIVGGLPFVGDALMIGKVGKGVKTFIQSAGLWEAISNTPELSAFSKKLANGKFDDITIDEWKGALKFFRGLTGAGRVMKSNASLNNAAKASGLETKYNWRQKLLGTGPTINTKAKTYNVKAKVGDQEVDVELNQSQYDGLVEGLRKIRPGKNAKTKGEELIKNTIKEDPKIKAIKPDAKPEDITVTYSPTWRNYIPFFRSRSITSNFGVTERTLGGNSMQEFETSLQRRGFWDKALHGGSNRALRQYRRHLGLETNPNLAPVKPDNPVANPVPVKPNTSYIPEGIDQNTSNLLNNVWNTPAKKLTRESREIRPSKTKVNGEIKYGPSSAEGKLIDGNKFNIIYTTKSKGTPSEMIVLFNGQNIKIEGSTLGQQKANLGKWINEQNIKIQQAGNISLKASDQKWKDFVANIKDLKRLGYLYKQGGRIDKQKIQKYKEYIQN